ncbi:hypothetical protein [Streptomyces sp. NPDC058092]|uniref:hypothetical protein n=1 Tax=Streptomyces sp. NPDC058092 TaxID=3346336 RepID=UPI0036E45EBF
MDTPRPTPPSGIRSAGRALGKGIAYVVGTLVGAWLLIIILGNIIWWDVSDDKPEGKSIPPLIPSPTANPFQWVFAGQACQDGWHSPSIGQQGACSHHGGVVTWYQSNVGNLTTSCDFLHQAATLERARQLADGNGNVACDFENPRFEEQLPQERP